MNIFSKKLYKTKPLEELIKLAQRDNLDALEELVKRTQNSVYAAFYYLTGDCSEILDLTQEALLKMAKSIKTLKDPAKFKSWLNQITTRLFYDHLRVKNRKLKTIPIDKKEDEEQERFSIAEIPCDICTPEESTINMELQCLIENSIRKLPNAFKMAIVLRELQGLSYEEIAEITNTNVGTVKSRISRARNRLQEDLKHYIA